MLILLLLYHSGHLQLQKPLLQLLVNMAASSSTCLQHIWDQCFPGRFAALAKTLSGRHGCNLSDHCYQQIVGSIEEQRQCSSTVWQSIKPAVHMVPMGSHLLCLSAEETAGPLSTLLLLAAKDSPPRASSLCSPSAAALLRPLLTYIASCSQPSAAAGTLGLIIHHVIWQQNLLQAAMTSLMLYSTHTGPQNCQQVFRLEPCLEHIIMLQLLADELEDPAAASR